MNLQKKGDIIDLLIFINLVLASVSLVAFESSNESIILLISFGYIGVEKKELITPVGAVAFISLASTSGMFSAIFSLLGKICIEIFRHSSRITYHVTRFSIELWNLYGPDCIEKKILGITTFPCNDPQKACKVARNGADFRKRRFLLLSP